MRTIIRRRMGCAAFGVLVVLLGITPGVAAGGSDEAGGELVGLIAAPE